MRDFAPRRTAVAVWMLAPTAASAMDEAASVAGLSAVISIGAGVIGGAVAGWRRWRFWPGVLVTWGACSVLVVVAHFLLRGRFDLGRYVELFFIGTFVSAIPLALCFVFAYALSSLIARSVSTSADNDSKG